VPRHSLDPKPSPYTTCSIELPVPRAVHSERQIHIDPMCCALLFLWVGMLLHLLCVFAKNRIVLPPNPQAYRCLFLGNEKAPSCNLERRFSESAVHRMEIQPTPCPTQQLPYPPRLSWFGMFCLQRYEFSAAHPRAPPPRTPSSCCVRMTWLDVLMNSLCVISCYRNRL